MKCPHCAVESADAAAECAGCGLVFAKWRERAERDKARRESQPPPVSLAGAEAPVFRGFASPWTGRVLALGLVAAWLVGLSLYLRIRYAGGAPPGEEPAVLVRDPRTGDLKRLVLRAPPRPAPRPAAPAPPVPPPLPPPED